MDIKIIKMTKKIVKLNISNEAFNASNGQKKSNEQNNSPIRSKRILTTFNKTNIYLRLG